MFKVRSSLAALPMKPFWCHYNWIEDTLRGYASALRQAGIEDVVAIQRGGIFPGLVAACLLDIPLLRTLQHERKSRLCRWTCATPPKGATLLLVDDIAGSGDTLTDAKRWLEEQGHAVKTLTVAHDVHSRLIPDFGVDFGDAVAVFPWERHRLSPAFLADLAKPAAELAGDSTYEAVALDLDGIFLPDLPDGLYETNLASALELRARLPPFPASALPPHRPDNALIITSRHLDSRAPTMDWLARHGFGGYPVVFRDIARYPDGADKALGLARYKADMAVRHGVTAVYESDPLQAAYLAGLLPLTDVYCWNNERNIRLRLGRSTLLGRS